MTNPELLADKCPMTGGRNESLTTRIGRRVACAAACAISLVAVLASSGGADLPATLPTGFHDQLVMDGLDRPVGMAFLPDGRLIVIENDTGRVRLIVDGKMGAVDPIGTVDSLQWAGDEQGLMGVAVDAQWPARPYLYFHFAGNDSSIHITRYRVLGDLDESTSGFLLMDPVSKYHVLRDIPDFNALHDGGTLRFGPDGMLYGSFGDDGMACTATDSTLFSGTILRMDVSGLPDGPGGPPDRQLLVPGDNPFATHPDVNVRLVWALGLRNPFRFHIDPATGAMMVADVGQHDSEEVDYFPGSGGHGGWPYFEGARAFVTTQCGPPAPAPLTPPAYAYQHATLLAGAASVISAGVYRPTACAGCSFPGEYDGDYFFSDFYEGFLRRLKLDGGVWSLAPPVSGQPNATDWGTGFRLVSDYLPAADGALWYCRWAESYETPNSGEIRRIYYQVDPAVVGHHTAAGVSFDAPHPSPSRGIAHFSYTLPFESDVALELFDLSGRRVRLVAQVRQGAGVQRAAWDGRTESGQLAPPGVYVARLTTEGVALTRRFPLVR